LSLTRETPPRETQEAVARLGNSNCRGEGKLIVARHWKLNKEV